jgi:hypothetical protein
MTQITNSKTQNEMSKEIYETIMEIIKDCKGNKYCYSEVSSDFEYDVDVEDILFILHEILEINEIFPYMKQILCEFIKYM